MSNDVLEPLTWDGSTLSIPRASTTRDGYLSQTAFILFSGAAHVPVTSFNTRTGDVILLEDDVLAALGYVPLNKHGDTMTGPLTLAGAPTADLHAATRAYVDAQASSAAGAPDIYLLSDFNASGSKLKFNGAISASSPTLTLTVASDFKVGHGILIFGAGSGGARLFSTVAAIDATKKIITLSNPASATVTASTTNVQHDETLAIQTAINTVCNAGGGKIVPAAGYYRINGPINPATNSILAPPFRSLTSNRYITLEIEAPFFPMPSMGGEPDKGVIFQSDRIGTNDDSSIFAAALWSPTQNDFAGVNAICIVMRGINWRTYSPTQISALDLGMCTNCIVEKCLIDTGEDYPSFTQPTHAGTFGLRLPRVNNSQGAIRTENVQVNSYGKGIIVADFWMADWTAVSGCLVGIEIGISNFIVCGRVLIYYCPMGISIVGAVSIDLLVDYEKSGSGWSANPTGHDIYDPTNVANGSIKYRAVQTGTGPVDVSTTGLSKCLIHNMTSGVITQPV